MKTYVFMSSRRFPAVVTFAGPLNILISKDGYEIIIIGDMNTDINLDSVRSMNLLDSLPDYRIIPLSLNGLFRVIGKKTICHFIFQLWPYSLVHYMYPLIYSSQVFAQQKAIMN